MEEIKQSLIDFLMSGGKELGILLCSMVPIIELRGAIPLGWATNTPWWLTYLLAVVGNMLPVPFSVRGFYYFESLISVVSQFYI